MLEITGVNGILRVGISQEEMKKYLDARKTATGGEQP
jgi:hypothetical protein